MKRGTDGAATPRRAGIFGGTFDPPHLGHVSVARDVADALDLDRVLWVPTRRSPHKEGRPPVDAPMRLAMVREAVKADQRFEVETGELERPPPSYTVETLESLRARFGTTTELVLIIGIDQWRAFDTWRDPGRIRELATIAVMDRGGESVADNAGVLRVPVRRIDVSSTAVRAAAAAGRRLTGLVPSGVAAIIEREGLYRD